jgi:hypothetical protein
MDFYSEVDPSKFRKTSSRFPASKSVPSPTWLPRLISGVKVPWEFEQALPLTHPLPRRIVHLELKSNKEFAVLHIATRIPTPSSYKGEF